MVAKKNVCWDINWEVWELKKIKKKKTYKKPQIENKKPTKTPLNTLSKTHNTKKEQRGKCRIFNRVNNCLTGKRKQISNKPENNLFCFPFCTKQFSLNLYPFSKAQLTICFMQVKQIFIIPYKNTRMHLPGVVCSGFWKSILGNAYEQRST